MIIEITYAGQPLKHLIDVLLACRAPPQPSPQLHDR